MNASRSLGVDVLVLGGGPAGASAACVLSRGGASVVLAERSNYDRFRVGETLPPEANALLARLGLAGVLGRDGHLRSPGTVAAWGQGEPHENDFIFSPYGHGWHLDRRRFDESLSLAAAEAGAERLTGARAISCGRGTRRRWVVALDTPASPLTIDAQWVVDATGRAGWFARSRGVARRVYDRLVAVVGVLDDTGGSDPRTFIEAMPDGWWYASALPDGRAIAAFFTDSDLHDLRPVAAGALWADRLAASALVGDRLATGRAVAAPRVVACSTTKATRATGDGWLAVGDAARAIDPLSSLGISWAITSGIEAAGVVLVADTAGAAGRHESDWEERFVDYLKIRRRYYSGVSRWSDAPFWRRRSVEPAALRRHDALNPNTT
jgi:flavin-dependent dehydrogenase